MCRTLFRQYPGEVEAFDIQAAKGRQKIEKVFCGPKFFRVFCRFVVE